MNFTKLKLFFYQLKELLILKLQLLLLTQDLALVGMANATEIYHLFSFNSGSDLFFFSFVSYSFHRTLPYYSYVQNRFRSVCLSTHVTLETIRTCGLIKIVKFICSQGVSPLLVDEFTGRA